MILRVLISIGLAFGLTSCLKDAPHAAPASAPSSLTLTGMVVDLAGKPMANVAVFVEQDQAPLGATGEDGFFFVRMDDDKLTRVSGTERNTRDAFYLYFESGTDSSLIGVSDFVPLVERGEKRMPTVVMKNAATVTGKVLVLQGATVEPAVGTTVRMGRATTLTGADGAFILTKIPAGKLTLTATAPKRSASKRDVEVLVGEAKSLAQPLVLFPEIGVTGQFLLGAQLPLAELVAAGHPFVRRFEVQASQAARFMRFHSDPVTLTSLPPRPIEPTVEFDFPRDGGNTLYYQFYNDGLDKSDIYKLSVVLDQFGETSGFVIEDGTGRVSRRTVQLKVDVPAAAYRMRLAESRETLSNRLWEPVTPTSFYTFEIARNPITNEAIAQVETRTLFLQFQDALGLPSPIYQASTQLELFPLPVASVFKIENGAPETAHRLVRLDITVPTNAREMRVFEAGLNGGTQEIIGAGGGRADVQDPRVRTTEGLWLPATPNFFFNFPSSGLRTLYVQFRTGDGLLSPIFSQIIRVLPFQEADVGFTLNGGAQASPTKHVTLSLNPPAGALRFRVAESGGANGSDSIDRATWLSLVPHVQFETEDTGLRTFFVQYANVDLERSPVYTQSIFVDPFVAGPGDFVINGGAPVARDPLLVLHIAAPSTAVSMAVVENAFPTSFQGQDLTQWLAIAPTATLVVRGTGSKSILVKFKDEEGEESPAIQHVVFFDPFPIDGALNGVTLDSGAPATTASTVSAAFVWSAGVREMRFGLDPSALATAPFVTVDALEEIAIPVTPGVVKVYVQYRLSNGETSPVFFDEIEQEAAPAAPPATPPSGP